MTSAATPAAGSAIASTLLAKIPRSFSFVPGEVGNGFSTRWRLVWKKYSK
jgi:hypothetical protein